MPFEKKNIGGRRGWLLGASVGVLMAATAGQAGAQEMLRFAVTDDPPHLDAHVTTAGLTSLVDIHVLETLYTLNSAYEPVPLLATGETISDDGLTVTIGIRDDVTFHDGSALTADDVVASLERWGAHGGRGKVLFDHIESVEATGEHEVTINFTNVFGPWKTLLGYINGGPAIFPAEILEDQGAEPLDNDQIIGTGPYRFSEWRPNRHIEIVAYDDYSQPEGETDGYAGEREVNFETIRFIAVPDIGTRVSGVQAGDYDVAERIPGDLYADLDADPGVQAVVHGTPQMVLLFFNNEDGIFADNYKLRQAIQAALDHAEAHAIAVGPEDLWNTNPSIMPEGSIWYTEAGTERHNVADPELAMELAEEAGYDGEPIRMMVSPSYPLHYDVTQVWEQQLTAAGFNIELETYDWATLLDRRAQPDLWDNFTTTHGFVPDPILYTFLNDNYPGWWTSPEKEELEARFTATNDMEERQEIWADIQELMFEQVPVIKPGDVFLFDLAAADLEGLGTDKNSMPWPRFWGVSRN